MTLFPHLSINFGATIWRMEIDELSDTLFLEIRGNEEKQVSFAAVDLNKNHLNFKGLQTPERWLAGIETAYNNVLLLHYYQTETGPTHKGLMAVDAQSGETLWSNYSYAFSHLCINGPVVYDTRLQPHKLILLDIKSGATLGSFEPSVHIDMEPKVVVPEIVSEDFFTVKCLPAEPFGNMIHHLDHNNFRIVSLHALQAGQLKQVLYVFDGLNKVFDDLLNTDIQKIQPEAFILHKNRLIYIKNKAELVVLSL